LGEGVDTDWSDKCDPAAFRDKYGVYDEFILYAGRKDIGKKTDELIRFFTEYKEKHPASALKLVLLGGGELPQDVSESDQILDLGFVSPEDKHNAFAAAAFFLQSVIFRKFFHSHYGKLVGKKTCTGFGALRRYNRFLLGIQRRIVL
jgi:glycosyltransferase involved in cell wall biosynthesis